jgi:hypothetical protein
MNYLHYDLGLLSQGDWAEVTLSAAANVRLLDPTNYAHFKAGRKHSYYGGYAKHSPVRIRIPRTGTWYLVVDLGGFAGQVKASVRAVKS